MARSDHVVNIFYQCITIDIAVWSCAYDFSAPAVYSNRKCSLLGMCEQIGRLLRVRMVKYGIIVWRVLERLWRLHIGVSDF
jgi:hypothetical protein